MYSLFDNLKSYLKPFGRGGVLKLWEEKDRSINQSVTEVFVEQPLSLPGSAKKNLTKIRKIKFLDDFCGYLGPPNYVFMRKRGTLFIAPKLCRAHFEGSKTLRAQNEGFKTP